MQRLNGAIQHYAWGTRDTLAQMRGAPVPAPEPEAELWVGNPARCVRRLDDKAIEGLLYSAAHYVRVKDDYLRNTPAA